jgi:hypothetical protein
MGLDVLICRFVDDDQPGWVECRFTDAHGREWSIVEKVPVVCAEDLDARSPYPRPGIVGCRVVERRRDAAGRELALIDTEWPWSIAATSGETRFEVASEQLTDLADPAAPDAAPSLPPLGTVPRG